MAEKEEGGAAIGGAARVNRECAAAAVNPSVTWWDDGSVLDAQRENRECAAAAVNPSVAAFCPVAVPPHSFP